MPKKKKEEESETSEENKEDLEKEESELEEEIQEQDPIKVDKLQSLLKLKNSAPVLERITQGKSELNLEQGVGFTGAISKEKKEERKYTEEPKYDVNEEYSQSARAQKNPGFSEFSASRADFERIGRQQDSVGRAVTDFNSGVKMESSSEYETLSVGNKSPFEKKKTRFQENLEKRYDF